MNLMRKIPVRPKPTDHNKLFWMKGDLYRKVSMSHDLNYRWAKTKEFLDSILFRELSDMGYVPKHYLVKDNLYRVETIDHFTYPCEWSQAQIKAALLLICRINKFLISRGSDIQLTDCHLCNITYKHTKPIYVDIGSFSHITKDMIPKHINLSLGHLTNSAYLMKTSPKTVKEWEVLESYLKNFDEFTETTPIWDAYDQSEPPHTVKHINPVNNEQKLLLNWVKTISPHIKSILDIGSNTGVFSRLFAREGIDIVSIDRASYVINQNFKTNQKLNLPITCASLDITQKTRKQNECKYFIIGKKKSIPVSIKQKLPCLLENWKKRFSCDAVFCSSISHHLYREGCSFKQQFAYWNELGRKYLLIEYISPEDEHLIPWRLDKRKYNLQNFTRYIKQKWRIIDQAKPHKKERVWFLASRK